MSRYCTVCWRNARLQPDHWSDCTQEVLARLLERVAPDRWEHVLKQESEERREFLRAIDTVKKRSQRAHRPGSLEADVPDGRGVRSQALTDIRQSVLQAAEQSLTARQFEIVRLTLDGWSVAEIAEHLDLPATRVSDEKYKAIQRLRDALSERA
jgi:RNA polymerase sigma factor (sigma-70 family)